MHRKDTIYESEMPGPGDFVFDDRVVSVFPDMINRSVPGYGLIVPMIGLLARRYALANSRLYDLGCSLGAVSLAMQAAVHQPGVEILAVDSSAEMIRQLKANLAGGKGRGEVNILTRQCDILEIPIENASVVVLNFTLQFLEHQRRQELLNKIAKGLNPGGILVLSEKICFETDREQQLQTLWHHDFKKAQGYSDLEIARKRDALENILKPESMQQHRVRLKTAGFDHVNQWFQAFNFVSMVAFKGRGADI